jgi:hypothetical protein
MEYREMGLEFWKDGIGEARNQNIDFFPYSYFPLFLFSQPAFPYSCIPVFLCSHLVSLSSSFREISPHY